MEDYRKEVKRELLKILQKYANGEARGDGLCKFTYVEAAYELREAVSGILFVELKRWSQAWHKGSEHYSVKYPFCPDEYDIAGERGEYYSVECYNKRCHLNPLRMEFVRELIERLWNELREGSTDA